MLKDRFLGCFFEDLHSHLIMWMNLWRRISLPSGHRGSARPGWSGFCTTNATRDSIFLLHPDLLSWSEDSNHRHLMSLLTFLLLIAARGWWLEATLSTSSITDLNLQPNCRRWSCIVGNADSRCYQGRRMCGIKKRSFFKENCPLWSML